jgi:hypothetical protein
VTIVRPLPPQETLSPTPTTTTSKKDEISTTTATQPPDYSFFGESSTQVYTSLPIPSQPVILPPNRAKATLYQQGSMHPGLIAALVFCALLEVSIVFALVYAGLQRYDGRKYGRRVKDAARGRLYLGR